VARFFDLHPDNPQPRLVAQLVHLLRDGAVIAYPTDSGYALGARMGDVAATARIKEIRQLGDHHHFTLVCADMAQVGQFAVIGNHAFRAIKAALPGPYTFILPASREVPRRLAHPRKRTVGVRIPPDPLVRALLREFGEPLLSSTLLLPGQELPLTDGWEVKELFDNVIDAVVDTGRCGDQPTTVVDWSGDEPEVIRIGGGAPSRFE
jgi:tRNA threonylcarbamoyl adenosine modification protein (Sua5/YciO/YrdC/YwlC family)